ncbi:MAG: hypothetical protein H0X35_11745 [Pseudonocardiales bacterium]|nr:hypothetical protein [Pseudonocardiales bacterium]
MIRLRWGLAALTVAIAAAVGLFAYASSSTEPQVSVGLTDAQHVGAAHALVVALPATTPDPYDTACRAPAALCLSSQLAPKTLLNEAGAALKAAGATRLSQQCATSESDLALGCQADYDFHGAHISVLANGTDGQTSVALRTYTRNPAATAIPAHVVRPLADWAQVNPFPAAWHLTAPCYKTSAAGCLEYRHQFAAGAPIAATLQQASADARAALTAAGFSVQGTGCYPAAAGHRAFCSVSGSRFRDVGGVDGVLALVSLRTVDATHVIALAGISAL